MDVVLIKKIVDLTTNELINLISKVVFEGLKEFELDRVRKQTKREMKYISNP